MKKKQTMCHMLKTMSIIQLEKVSFTSYTLYLHSIDEPLTRTYYKCCRDGKPHISHKVPLTSKKRQNQKKSRKMGLVCLSRLYVDEFSNGEVKISYITAHTNHQPGPSEDVFLPLPKSVHGEIAIKLNNGISPERVMEVYTKI